MLEKRLRKYIAPNVFAMIGTSCYIFADTFFIASSEGANGITALNLILPLYGIIYALGAMIGIGSATRYSLYKSIGNKGADDYFSNAIIWTIIASLPFVIAGFLIPEVILKLMGADSEILKLGLPYIQIILCFTPFFMLNFTFTAFVRNDGEPKLAMIATLVSGIINIIFDYILVFPMQLGMVGAALATAISPIVSIGICMIHYLSKKNNIRFIKKLPSLKKLLSACSLGVVAFVGEISSGITTMVFNFLLLDLLGNIGVAAYGVVANMAIIATALFNGVAQGLQPLASEVHGQGDQDSEKRIYHYSLKIALGIAVLMIGFVLIFTAQLVSIFNSENSLELAYYAEPGMRIYFLGFFVAAINIVKAGFYSATGKSRESSIISLSRGIIAIVIFAFGLSKIFGVVGVWFAFLASEIFTLVLSKIMTKWTYREVEA